jgi:hypothetical protein
MSAGQLAVNLAGIVTAGVLVLALRPRAGSEGGPITRLEKWWWMRSLSSK